MKRVIFCLVLGLIMVCLPGWCQTDSSCANLNFEAGTFAGWNAGEGNLCADGSNPYKVCFRNPGIPPSSSSNERIVTVGLDTNVRIPMVYPGEGRFSAKMGDRDYSTDLLTRKITVTADQPAFVVNYALVMRLDPGSNGITPYFEFRIIDENNVLVPGSRIIKYYTDSDMIRAANYFSYFPWHSYTVDLSAYIGRTLEVQFITNEQYYFDWSYAYIDGSCTPVQKKCVNEPVYFTANSPGAGAKYMWDFGNNMPLTQQNPTVTFNVPRNYPVTLSAYITKNGRDSLVYQQSQIVSVTTANCAPPINCATCLPDFSPVPGQQYVISAWVQDTTAFQLGAASYSSPALKVSFDGSTQQYVFKAKGKIIDGWQRIQETFTVPAGAASISVSLTNLGINDGVFFDDVRVHHNNGSMKSFVYDPISLRLMAILDENNYGTFYEYDDEGILVRVKRETERGIVTTNESRNNIKK